MTKRKFYPALRGLFGDWAYYSCLMSLKDVADCVNYAKEIHKNEHLSDMIQRQLKEGRGKDICEYLKTVDRFFNSIVVAVYRGDPNWHEVSAFSPKSSTILIDEIPLRARNSLGFLSFSGEEKLFALDGQHRLAGIKQAMKDVPSVKEDEVSVVIVAHRTTTAGLQRTRRLFTTLNKTAKPVSKGEIIALDEDDVMAITVRRLVEGSRHFSGDRILYTAKNNIAPTDSRSLTTIGNLYDVLKVVFTKTEPRRKAKELTRVRPPETDLDQFERRALAFFGEMSRCFRPLRRFFTRRSTGLLRRCRGPHGGHILFRPVGLKLFANLAADLSKTRTLRRSMQLLARLPQRLNQAPFRHVLWDPDRRRILSSGASLSGRLLLYMLGMQTNRTKLERDYNAALGDHATPHCLARLGRM